jgi:hypothetical protein
MVEQQQRRETSAHAQELKNGEQFNFYQQNMANL